MLRRVFGMGIAVGAWMLEYPEARSSGFAVSLVVASSNMFGTCH